MAFGVVKLFKVVQIQNNNGQRMGIALRALNFGGASLEKSPPVMKPRQSIPGRAFMFSFKL